MTIAMRGLKLSTNRALWGHVRPNLRAVYVNNISNVVYVWFYFEGTIEEIDLELVEDAMTEIMADFGKDDQGKEVEYDYHAIRLDYPHTFPDFGECVYLRYEPPVS